MLQQGNLCTADEKLSFADVGRRLGEIWRGLDENDKRPYQEQVCYDTFKDWHVLGHCIWH